MSNPRVVKKYLYNRRGLCLESWVSAWVVLLTERLSADPFRPARPLTVTTEERSQSHQPFMLCPVQSWADSVRLQQQKGCACELSVWWKRMCDCRGPFLTSTSVTLFWSATAEDEGADPVCESRCCYWLAKGKHPIFKSMAQGALDNVCQLLIRVYRHFTRKFNVYTGWIITMGPEDLYVVLTTKYHTPTNADIAHHPGGYEQPWWGKKVWVNNSQKESTALLTTTSTENSGEEGSISLCKWKMLFKIFITRISKRGYLDSCFCTSSLLCLSFAILAQKETMRHSKIVYALQKFRLII